MEPRSCLSMGKFWKSVTLLKAARDRLTVKASSTDKRFTLKITIFPRVLSPSPATINMSWAKARVHRRDSRVLGPERFQLSRHLSR